MNTNLTNKTTAAAMMAWIIRQRWAQCSQCGNVELTRNLDAERYHVVENDSTVFDVFLCERCQRTDEQRDYERRG